MKNIPLYFVLLILLSAFQCDDEFVPDDVVETTDLVSIEDNIKQFAVGDYMFINTFVNNQQMTADGKKINLTDYLFPDETELVYFLALYKIDSNDQEIPYIIKNVQETEGMILDYEGESPVFYIQSPYHPSSGAFSSKIGIKLEEPGSYVLTSGTYRNNFYSILFDLRNTNNKTVEMTTTIANADADGVYRFTVN